MGNTVLLDWIKVAWKKRKLLVISVVGPAIISLLVSLLLPKMYKSTVKALLPEVASGGKVIQTPLGSISGGGVTAPISSQAVISILESNYVADRIISKFNIQKLYNLKKEVGARNFLKNEMMTISTDENAGLIKITVKSRYNDLNPKIANYAIPLVDSANKNLNLTSESNILKVVEKAEPAVKKYFPKYSLNTVAGGIFGFIIFFIYIYYRENLSLTDDEI